MLPSVAGVGLALLLLYSVVPTRVEAFAGLPTPLTGTTGTSPARSLTTRVRISRHEVEQYRANLENLMRQQNELEDLQHGKEDPQLSSLTSTARHRRMLEIELMKNLKTSDDAINELMHLWMYENDASMAHELENMQDECSPGMRYEEGRLRQMIRQFPTWAEPRARLALLLFFQGRTHDSHDAALDTLCLKPWHFEIYPLLVLLSLRKGDFGQALSWARRALPPFRPDGPNKRRNEWIRIAVELAQDQLAQAETRSKVRGGPARTSTGSTPRRRGRKAATAEGALNLPPLSSLPRRGVRPGHDQSRHDPKKNKKGSSSSASASSKSPPKRASEPPEEEEDTAWQ
jgi:hypothetical protein